MNHILSPAAEVADLVFAVKVDGLMAQREILGAPTSSSSSSIWSPPILIASSGLQATNRTAGPSPPEEPHRVVDERLEGVAIWRVLRVIQDQRNHPTSPLSAC